MKKFTVNVWASTSVSITLFADDKEEARDLVHEGNFSLQMLLHLLDGSHFDWDLGEIDESDITESDEPILIGMILDDGTECLECAITRVSELVSVIDDDGYPDGVTCVSCGDSFYDHNYNAQEA